MFMVVYGVFFPHIVHKARPHFAEVNAVISNDLLSIHISKSIKSIYESCKSDLQQSLQSTNLRTMHNRKKPTSIDRWIYSTLCFLNRSNLLARRAHPDKIAAGCLFFARFLFYELVGIGTFRNPFVSFLIGKSVLNPGDCYFRPSQSLCSPYSSDSEDPI